ncbi:MAG: class I SAM-dependent methyltransferase, partial [Bdellovibrionales bacterium]|nr:class I SAM-dependent methyltransferase [Bdellovibrionales bacterium]
MSQCAQQMPAFQSSNLELRSDGLWVSKDQSEIAYPESGNEGCYQIEENSFWFRHRNNAIVSVIRAFAPNGAIYDIGGGNGFVSLGMKDAGFDVVLVEPGVSGALNGKKRGLETVVCSTLQDAQFAPHSLPAVGIFDVLEHIEDDVAFLQMIRAALRPDGKLYLTVPAYQWLWSQEDVYAQHYKRYTISQLKKT